MILLRRVIGDALRARRQAQHRTLREVSTAANVSLGYLSEIERGQKEASSELLAAVCDALGARLSEVLRDVSSTVATTEQREGVAPGQREAATLDGATLDGVTMDRQGALAPSGQPAASQPAMSGTALSGTALSETATPEPATPEPVARLSTPALAASARADAETGQADAVSTLVEGDVAVTVRRDGPLSARLTARTIRRDVLSGV
jgi:transcriptional regulator with XRE-family HTH domain